MKQFITRAIKLRTSEAASLVDKYNERLIQVKNLLAEKTLVLESSPKKLSDILEAEQVREAVRAGLDHGMVANIRAYHAPGSDKSSPPPFAREDDRQADFIGSEQTKDLNELQEISLYEGYYLIKYLDLAAHEVMKRSYAYNYNVSAQTGSGAEKTGGLRDTMATKIKAVLLNRDIDSLVYEQLRETEQIVPRPNQLQTIHANLTEESVDALDLIFEELTYIGGPEQRSACHLNLILSQLHESVKLRSGRDALMGLFADASADLGRHRPDFKQQAMIIQKLLADVQENARFKRCTDDEKASLVNPLIEILGQVARSEDVYKAVYMLCRVREKLVEVCANKRPRSSVPLTVEENLIAEIDRRVESLMHPHEELMQDPVRFVRNLGDANAFLRPWIRETEEKYEAKNNTPVTEDSNTTPTQAGSTSSSDSNKKSIN